MAISVRFENTEDLRELATAIDALPGYLNYQVWGAALRGASVPIQRSLRESTEYRDRSGRLRRSWRRRARRTRVRSFVRGVGERTVTIPLQRVSVYSTAPYAALVELGTEAAAAHPYAEAALRRAAGQAAAAAEDAARVAFARISAQLRGSQQPTKTLIRLASSTRI